MLHEIDRIWFETAAAYYMEDESLPDGVRGFIAEIYLRLYGFEYGTEAEMKMRRGEDD